MLIRQLQFELGRAAVGAILSGEPAIFLLIIHFATGADSPILPLYIVAMGSMSLWQARRVYTYLFRPERTSIGKCLRQFGPDPWKLAQIIDEECGEDGMLIEGILPSRIGWRPYTRFTVLTENWLVHVARGRLVILIPDKICWIYRKIAAQPQTFSPSRFRHSVCCRTANGDTELDVATSTEMIALWLASELMRRRPYMLSGYQGDWVGLGRLGPAMLLRRIEQRRLEYEQLSRAEQALWIEEAIDDLDEFPSRIDPFAPETMK